MGLLPDMVLLVFGQCSISESLLRCTAGIVVVLFILFVTLSILSQYSHSTKPRQSFAVTGSFSFFAWQAMQIRGTLHLSILVSYILYPSLIKIGGLGEGQPRPPPPDNGAIQESTAASPG
jgi:hypothetical protein